MSIRTASAAAIALGICSSYGTVRAGTVLLGGFNFNNVNYLGVAGTTSTLMVNATIKNSPTFVTGTTVNGVGVDPVHDFGEKSLQFALGGNNLSTLTFAFNAKGYSGIGITFAAMITGTYFTSDQLSFSTNGTSFHDFGTAFSPSLGSFQLVDRGPFVALDDVETAYIRLTINGPSMGNGVFQIDNVQITGTPIAQGAPAAVPLPSAALAGGAVLGLRALRRRRHR